MSALNIVPAHPCSVPGFQTGAGTSESGGAGVSDLLATPHYMGVIYVMKQQKWKAQYPDPSDKKKVRGAVADNAWSCVAWCLVGFDVVPEAGSWALCASAADIS